MSVQQSLQPNPLIEQVEKGIDTAMLSILRSSDLRFYANVFIRMKQDYTINGAVAAVSATTLYVCPSMFLALTAPQRIGLLIHECLHLCLNHSLRLGNRDHRRFNAACDYVINEFITTDLKLELPPYGLFNSNFRGMSEEAIYDAIEDENCDDAEIHFEGPETPGEERENAQKIEVLLKTAQQACGSAGVGKVPDRLREILVEAGKNKVSWQTVLKRSVVSRFAKKRDIPTYRRLNRRYRHIAPMPTYIGKTPPKIMAFHDVSGSITMSQHQEVLNELADIVTTVKPEKTTVVQFDCSVAAIDTPKTFHDIKSIKLKGGGGTALAEPVKLAVEQRPEILIIFTDGEIWDLDSTTQTLKNDLPRSQIIWLINGNPRFKCDVGQVIYYE